MRVRVILAFVLLLAGCGVQRSVDENTHQMEKTSRAIQENTQEIQRSTKAMHSFQRAFPFLFLILLLFLFVPAYVLFNLYRKLLDGQKPFSKKSTKTTKSFLKELFLP